MEQFLEQWVIRGGVPGLLALLLLGLLRRWWVLGWQYDMVLREREQYRNLYLKAIGLAEEAVLWGEEMGQDPSLRGRPS